VDEARRRRQKPHMKVFAALPVVLLLGACAPTTLLQQLGFQPGPPALKCDVEVRFESRCCGVNQQAHEQVSKVASRAKGVTQALEWKWGREGESTMCMVTASPDHGERLFVQLTDKRFPPSTSATTVSRGERHIRLEAEAPKT
jgi:hypothetical protein